MKTPDSMYYMTIERNRNVGHKAMYTDLLRRAFGEDARVVCSHHILVCTGPKAREEVFELPAADTVLFNPQIMRRVFGDFAPGYMAQLALTPPARREGRVRRWLARVDRARAAREARRGPRDHPDITDHRMLSAAVREARRGPRRRA